MIMSRDDNNYNFTLPRTRVFMPNKFRCRIPSTYYLDAVLSNSWGEHLDRKVGLPISWKTSGIDASRCVSFSLIFFYMAINDWAELWFTDVEDIHLCFLFLRLSKLLGKHMQKELRDYQFLKFLSLTILLGVAWTCNSIKWLN